MKKSFTCLVFTLAWLIVSGVAFAHFGMVIPSNSMIMSSDNKTVRVTLSFSHPFEMMGMDLDKPAHFGAVTPEGKKDLLVDLKETKVMGQSNWVKP